MEEMRMTAIGFEEISSSELSVRGGASNDIFIKVLEITVAVVTFVKNYWSSILKGYNDGRYGV